MEWEPYGSMDGAGLRTRGTGVPRIFLFPHGREAGAFLVWGLGMRVETIRGVKDIEEAKQVAEVLWRLQQ